MNSVRSGNLSLKYQRFSLSGLRYYTEDQGWEGNQHPPHSFRTSFYLFAAVCVSRGLPNLPQTVYREGSSIYNCQLLLKTGLI